MGGKGGKGWGGEGEGRKGEKERVGLEVKMRNEQRE